MKPKFEHINQYDGRLFTFLKLSQPQFEFSYHFHSHYELTWIKKGVGKRYVGSNVSNFSDNDLVLIGSNTPHCWLSENNNAEQVEATVIHFASALVDELLSNFPEMRSLKELFENSTAGLLFSGETCKEMAKTMESCAAKEGFEQYITLLHILHQAATSHEISVIDATLINVNINSAESDRFRKVFQYIIENYRHEISLGAVAEIASLTPNAFCRFFKSATHKTLFEVILDYRINDACFLLSQTDKTVSEICTESGFGNASYFNKKFKFKIGLSPLEYRKLFLAR